MEGTDGKTDPGFPFTRGSSNNTGEMIAIKKPAFQCLNFWPEKLDTLAAFYYWGFFLSF